MAILLRISLLVMLASRTFSFSPRSSLLRINLARTSTRRSFIGAGSRVVASRRNLLLTSTTPPSTTAGISPPAPSFRAPTRPSRSPLPRCFSGASSSSAGGESAMTMRNIGFDEMEDLIDDYEDNIRQGQDPGMVVVDVRTEPEVQTTGQISENTRTLPLQLILHHNAFAMPDDDFRDNFGFDKPAIDTTLVFTCAAGIRSVYACQAASAAGYRCVNYTGGANEWFGRRREEGGGRLA